MKHIILTVVAAFAALSSFAAQNAPMIIPQPQDFELTKGSCKISGITINCEPEIGDKAIKMISLFADHLTMVSGKTSTVATPVGLAHSVANAKVKGMSFLSDTSMAPESYSLSVKKGMIVVKAPDYNGFLYAVQTVKQMLPTAIYGNAPVSGVKWVLPCCEIKDSPRFAYRGLHFDCCRHFFSVAEVKKVLDIMSIYKLNRMHWHLTEDQGWRIEIKKYPKLTEIGAFRDGTQIGYDRNSNDGVRYGGYYTQDQIRDIVAYAEDLGITIIPEVDLPGHMQAALTSYPELGCKDSQPSPYKVWTRWGVSKQVLSVGKESTMRFLEDVVGEIAELFPGEYFHIGGDECPKDEWKTDPDCQAKIKELGLKSDENATAEQRLQNYVTSRMQSFLATKGKKIIGWDEVLEGELAEGATVMSWRGTKGGIKAAKAGYDVIMTPNTYCYFDYAQSADLASEPLSITKDPKRAVPIEKIYNYEPYDELPDYAQKHILGVQANIWTEYIGTNEYLEYMFLPRMLALSEVQWCPKGTKDYERFMSSLREHQYAILDLLGYNYKKY